MENLRRLDFPTLFMIAVGLAMDAFAVSVSCGLSIETLRMRHLLRIAAAFGLFQALMPVAGWALGLGFRDAVARVDHWIALALLGFIGIKMIRDSRESCRKRRDVTDWRILLALAVATSIDAFAVGLTFAFLDIAIVTPALLIGFITLIISGFGVFLGDRAGCLLGRKVEIAGGLILIAIGIRIAIVHILTQT